jgi:transcriptional regulator GlxA family with amidase domain
MSDLISEIQARRTIEDEAIRLGAERADLDNKLAGNMQATMDLMHQALAVGIGIDQLARMVGVSRQTLHRWRNVAAKRNA